MKAIKVKENKEFEVQEVEIPSILEDEILVEVEYCGICGSDLSRFYDGAKYYPIVLGHEFSGTVAKVGKGSKLEVGQKVVCAPLKPCFECESCKRGNYFACENYKFMGSGCDGAFQEFVSVKESNVIAIAQSLSLKKAAFIEPLAVGLHAIETLNINVLDKVAVIGCGTIGLMIIQSLKAIGIQEVIGIDISNDKLEMAAECEADTIIKSMDEYDGGFDVIFECTGVNFIQSDVINHIRPNGRICYVGTAHGDVKFESTNFEKLLRKEAYITGSWMSYSFPFPGNEWKHAVKLLEKEQVKVERLITLIDDSEMEKGFELMKSGNAYKVMVQLGKGNE